MQQSSITLGRHIIEEEHRHHPTEPESIHQKSLLAIGSVNDVLLFEKFFAGAAVAA